MINPLLFSLRHKKALLDARLDYTPFRVQRGYCGNTHESEATLDTFVLWLVTYMKSED